MIPMNKTPPKKMTRDEAIKVLETHGLATREAALAKYGDMIAAKWGECERDAGIALKAKDSHGLIVNAVIYFDPSGEWPADLCAAGKAILTNDDVKVLRKGG